MEKPSTSYLRKSYSYSPSNKPDQPLPKRPKIRKRHRLLRLFIFIIFLAILGGGTYALWGHKNKTVYKVVHSILPESSKSKPVSKSAGNNPGLNTMANSINSIINQNSGIDISVNLINLNNNQAEHYGVNETFQAASTAKIITAEDFLHEVEAGKQSLSETIDGNTAQYELQQMIVISDDDAWEDLNNTLGYNNLQNYADTTFRINDYQAYNNSLSSTDIALALQYLWEGKILNSSDTQLILSYMKQANYRQYIVPAIPSEDTIYHKIGLYQDYVNDAAIVTNGNQAFIIVIFTNGNGAYNWPQRATTMQSITKAALKYYFNQS